VVQRKLRTHLEVYYPEAIKNTTHTNKYNKKVIAISIIKKGGKECSYLESFCLV